MARVNLLDLAPHIITLQREIYSELSITGAIDPDNARLLTGCKDYCTYLIRDTLEYGREDAEEIIEQLMACESYCNDKGDRFNAGFFHTLVELLAVRYNITLFEGEVIDREVFEDEWPRIRDELGI
jgi:hypothetical protein